jgi:heme oxygenase (mycobilin-producing)
MILAISRFEVPNDREVDVKEAFFNRPHLVDNVPGFLGVETFTDAEDKAAFYLITRWTDQDSFRRWQSSPAHHQSHPGMPKGFRLDAGFTRNIVLERLTDAERPRSMSEILVDSEALITDAITGSDLLHLLVGDLSGNIKLCNGAAARSLGLTCNKLLDQPLATYLVESDAAKFAELVANSTLDFKSTFLLNFVNSKNEPYTLVCRIDVQPSHFILVGEPRIAEELGFQNELNELNNQLATLARENARKTKELAQAYARLESVLEELNRTHWHLRKVAEVLPMCIACGKVKSGDAKWQHVAEYFHNNSLLISHGCCPDCKKTLTEEWGLE